MHTGRTDAFSALGAPALLPAAIQLRALAPKRLHTLSPAAASHFLLGVSRVTLPVSRLLTGPVGSPVSGGSFWQPPVAAGAATSAI